MLYYITFSLYIISYYIVVPSVVFILAICACAVCTPMYKQTYIHVRVWIFRVRYACQEVLNMGFVERDSVVV